MVRAKKATQAPARAKSTRTSVKTSKKKAFDAAAIIKRATKQKAPKKAPTPVHISSPPQSPQSSASRNSTPLETGLDVSKIQYELNISCLLDQIRIITRVKHLVLGEFKLQPFLADTIKTMAQRAGKAQETVSWDDGRAELRHRGLKRVSDYPKNDVFDHGDWEEVEKALKAWMMKKVLDIRVDLCLNFKTVEEEIQPAQNARENASLAIDIEDTATPAPQTNRGVQVLENVAKNSAKQRPQSTLMLQRSATAMRRAISRRSFANIAANGSIVPILECRV